MDPYEEAVEAQALEENCAGLKEFLRGREMSAVLEMLGAVTVEAFCHLPAEDQLPELSEWTARLRYAVETVRRDKLHVPPWPDP